MVSKAVNILPHIMRSTTRVYTTMLLFVGRMTCQNHALPYNNACQHPFHSHASHTITTRLAEMIEAAQALVQRHGLLAPMVGHVGDGNFHMLLLVDPESNAEMEAAAACVDEMVAIAQSMGGTCTGMF